MSIVEFDKVLLEKKRVATKKFKLLFLIVVNLRSKTLRLICDHFLATDIVNFFTKKDLEKVFSTHFKNFKVEKGEPINLELIGMPDY